jgi:hypothetical protein
MSILNPIDRRTRDDTPAFRSVLPLSQGNSFVRILTARALASLHRLRGVTPADVAEKLWPNDRIVEHWLGRAATAPAMTSVPGWAAELAQRVVSDAIEALGPASAGAQVLKHCTVLNWNGAGSIAAPGFVAEFGNAGWVAEGNPIPVRQLAAGPAILNPHKLGAIAVLTREMMESSNAEALISDALVRAAGRMLDEVLFDANAEDAARPKGLRNGIATLTASNNSDAFGAVFEDTAAVINALAPVAGAGPYILVTSPGRAVSMSFRQPNVAGNNLIVLGSSAVTNDMLAIAPAALVAALSPEPEIETANAASIHMDTVPQAVGTAGPHRSMFQTDSIAIKVRWPVTWALRDPRGFAWLTPSWK